MRPPPLTEPPQDRDLILVGHGSRDPDAGVVLRRLRDAVARELPAIRVTLAWIELDAPLLKDVLPPSGSKAASTAPPPVVVPLLLSRGTHVSRDLPADAREPLGPDPLLTAMLLDRLSQADIAPGRPLVLAATGSTDQTGIADVRAQARLLEEAWGAPVRVGFVTAEPSIAHATKEAEAAAEGPAAIVSYFLAPGRLPDSARADTDHLGTHSALVALVLMRYRGAAPVGVTQMGL